MRWRCWWKLRLPAVVIEICVLRPCPPQLSSPVACESVVAAAAAAEQRDAWQASKMSRPKSTWMCTQSERPRQIAAANLREASHPSHPALSTVSLAPWPSATIL
jgi:hypothetical protein